MLQEDDGSAGGQPDKSVPEDVARVAELMSTFSGIWALAGGWAVDAWLGRLTREHGDVDILIFDQPLLFEHLAGWQLIGHEQGEVTQSGADLWGGRPLMLPAHLHGRPPGDTRPLPEQFDDNGMRILSVEDGFWLDVNLGERTGGEWALNREPRVALPLDQCIRQSGWGLPTVSPEVILFFKATLYVGTKNHLRPRDETDFLALLPLLTAEQRGWLREAVLQVYVGEHPWGEKLLV